MSVQRVCVVGAGALGGYMSGRLAQAEVEVTVIDRGAHLERLRRDGLTIVDVDGTESVADFTAVEGARAAGTHDLVILGVKAHQIEEVAPDLHHLFHEDTIVMTIQNGVPWWYFHDHGGPFDGLRLQTLDPHGIIEQHVPTRRIVGCVAYPAVTKPEPGVVRLVSRGRYPIGELDGTNSHRVNDVSRLLEGAGLRSRVLDDLRAEIWLKALGSASFNPVSALTGFTMEEMCVDPDTGLLIRHVMEEAEHIAHKLGIALRRTIDQRIEGGRAVGAHKTSMLQDVEQGERLEIEALVGAVAEIGRITDIPTPTIDAVYALVKGLDNKLGGVAANA